MNPDDPRHGTPAGYVAGCHDQCCSKPRQRQQKFSRVFREQGGRTLFDVDEVHRVVDPWLAQGLSPDAVMHAAGMASASLHRGVPVSRRVFIALTQVTEDDFHPTHKVYADLTRTRVGSLMAAGQQLRHMPVTGGGRWRARQRVSVGFARRVRDHYNAVSHIEGDSLITRVKARNAGYPHPMGWDDPGTLAWPLGAYSTLETNPVVLDEVVVDRLLAGIVIPTSTRPEREEAMRRWLASGRTETALSKIHGWPHNRYLTDTQLEESA